MSYDEHAEEWKSDFSHETWDYLCTMKRPVTGCSTCCPTHRPSARPLILLIDRFNIYMKFKIFLILFNWAPHFHGSPGTIFAVNRMVSWLKSKNNNFKIQLYDHPWSLAQYPCFIWTAFCYLAQLTHLNDDIHETCMISKPHRTLPYLQTCYIRRLQHCDCTLLHIAFQSVSIPRHIFPLYPNKQSTKISAKINKDQQNITPQLSDDIPIITTNSSRKTYRATSSCQKTESSGKRGKAPKRPTNRNSGSTNALNPSPQPAVCWTMATTTMITSVEILRW